MNVRLDYLFQSSLGLQNIFDGITSSGFTPARRRLITRHLLDLWTRIGHCNREPATAHDRKINYVVTDVGDFFFTDAAFSENLVEDLRFVRGALKHVIEFEVTGAQSDCLRDTLGDNSSLQTAQSRQRYRGSVMRMEAFGFNHVLAHNAVAGGLLMPLRMSVSSARSRSRSREEPDRAVGWHTVNIEEDDFDFFGPIGRHKHLANSNL